MVIPAGSRREKVVHVPSALPLGGRFCKSRLRLETYEICIGDVAWGLERCSASTVGESVGRI